MGIWGRQRQDLDKAPRRDVIDRAALPAAHDRPVEVGRERGDVRSPGRSLTRRDKAGDLRAGRRVPNLHRAIWVRGGRAGAQGEQAASVWREGHIICADPKGVLLLPRHRVIKEYLPPRGVVSQHPPVRGEGQQVHPSPTVDSEWRG